MLKTAQVKPGAACLGGRPVTRIVVTHFHADHFGLAAWLAAAWQAPVLMSESEFSLAQAWHSGREPHTRAGNLATYARHGLQPEDGTALLPHENLFRRGVPDIRAGVTPLYDGQVLSVIGREWRVVPGYGHSPQTGAAAMPVLSNCAHDARQTFFVKGATLSPLNYLRSRGQLEREAGALGIHRFARA